MNNASLSRILSRISICRSLKRAAVTTAFVALIAQAAISPAQANNDSQRPYKMRQTEFRAIRGAYDLDNGMLLRIYQQEGRYFAEFDNKRRIEVMAVAPATFVAPENGQRFTFHEHMNGLISSVTLSANPPAAASLAAHSPSDSVACVCTPKKP
jgi:hypothetical protein